MNSCLVQAFTYRHPPPACTHGICHDAALVHRQRPHRCVPSRHSCASVDAHQTASTTEGIVEAVAIDQQGSAPTKGMEAIEEQYDTVQRRQLQFGTANIPHPDKVSYGGEDAYFTSDVGGGAMGIADGVGGWQNDQINPAEYAKTFMIVARLYLEGKNVRMNVENGSVSLVPFSPKETIDGDGKLTPQGALQAGHVATQLPGSATACVIRFNRQSSSISAANLGDSGFMIVRDGFVVYRSPILQHYFDCPFQFGTSDISDTAENAELFEIEVEEGDLIIVASDGLWDNARDDEMMASIRFAGHEVSQVANALAQLASRNADDEEYESPYSVESIRQGYDLPWHEKLLGATFSLHGDGFRLAKAQGGKMDDITVVVARVSDVDIHVPLQQSSSDADSTYTDQLPTLDQSPAMDQSPALDQAATLNQSSTLSQLPT